MSEPVGGTIPSSEAKATRTEKVLALSLGSALSMIASLAYGMVAARWLSKHDYATLRQTFLAYDFAAPLLMLGLPNAVYYFLPREPQAKRGVIVDNMALLLGGAILFSLFIAFGGNRILAMRFDNPDLEHTLKWMIPYPLIMMPVAGLAAALVCAGRTKTLAIYNVLSSLTLTVGAILAILFTKSYAAPIMTRIIVPAVFLPVALVLMFKAVPGRVRGPHGASMMAMAKYSIPLGVASILGSITLQMHSVIVASMTSPENFAIYINGAMEIPLISIITGSITVVVFAEMAELCHKGEKVAALELFHKASLKSAVILFPAMCFLLVTAVPFIRLLFSDKYHASVYPFIVYLFVLPVRVVVYGAALMALGMTRVILVRSVIDLAINGILCFLLVKIFGYMGAAFALILTLYLWTTPFNLYKIAQGYEISWKASLPFKKLFTILTISILCMPLAGLGIYMISNNSFWKLALSAILYWPMVTFILYRTKLFVPPTYFNQFIPNWLQVNNESYL